MRKIMFVGRSESGKTTIMQAMKGKPITYHKTQYVNNFDVIIDTPGEYAETKQLSGALAVYGCEADVIWTFDECDRTVFSISTEYCVSK